jgi:hypothetical protein
LLPNELLITTVSKRNFYSSLIAPMFQQLFWKNLQIKTESALRESGGRNWYIILRAISQIKIGYFVYFTIILQTPIKFVFYIIFVLPILLVSYIFYNALQFSEHKTAEAGRKQIEYDFVLCITVFPSLKGWAEERLNQTN